MKALRIGNFELAGQLLDKGADPDIRDSGGRSAVFYILDADKFNYKVTFWQIMEFAESRGLRFDVTDNHGASPLMYRIGRIDALKAEALLNWEEKYSPNFSAGRKSRKDYYTDLLGLHLSGENYHYPFWDRLLEAGASAAGARDKDGFSAVLHISWLGSGDTALVRRLVSLGAPVDEFDERGESLLMHALSGGDDGISFTPRRAGKPAKQGWRNGSDVRQNRAGGQPAS